MKWRIYPSQRGRVNKLVRRRCCCYDHGNCILLDDGEPHRCVQIISRSGIYCNYFRRAVLPSDSELYAFCFFAVIQQQAVALVAVTAFSANKGIDFRPLLWRDFEQHGFQTSFTFFGQ